MNTLTKDAELIHELGGPTKVAALLQLEKQGGVQRVQNWMTRGIPSAIKVKFPNLFMPELAQDSAPMPHDRRATDGVHRGGGNA